MATPNEVLKMWLNGDITLGFALRQFFTDHSFGCSIPRKLKLWGFLAMLWMADHSGPWFARKHLVNLCLQQEVYYDFQQSDHVIQGDPICLKW